MAPRHRDNLAPAGDRGKEISAMVETAGDPRRLHLGEPRVPQRGHDKMPTLGDVLAIVARRHDNSRSAQHVVALGIGVIAAIDDRARRLRSERRGRHPGAANPK
jgi:hypothetical protein